jgi:hypothetical protein
LGLLVAAACVVTGRAAAQPPPAATFDVAVPECESDTEPFPYSCAYDYVDSDAKPSSGSWLGATSGGEIPMADLQIARSGYDGENQAWARIWYFVLVRSAELPPPVPLVPLVVRLRGQVDGALADGELPAILQAYAGSLLGTDPPVQGDAQIDARFSTFAEFDVTETVLVAPNTPFEVQVDATIRSSPGGGSGQVAGQAVADPEFWIDPSFPYAAAFSVETSANLWAIFFDGFESGSSSAWSLTTP